MDILDIAAPMLQLNATVAAACASALKQQGWVFMPGQQWQKSFSLSQEHWVGFARYWDNLALDLHMGDNGVYRHRRYSSFQVSPSAGQITLYPHQPYTQPKAVNPLNGDVERHYPPLETAFIEHPFFQALLLGLGDIYDRVSGNPETWTVKLHPYRIRADLASPGKPTPEGLHRDGVDFIAMMLIHRVNVEGGETTITDNQGTHLFSKTMTSSMDIILGDDHRIMHEVSAVQCTDRPGHRDAFVIAFARTNSHA